MKPEGAKDKTGNIFTDISDCQPGATKAEIFEALRIAAKTTIKPKPDSKKPS